MTIGLSRMSTLQQLSIKNMFLHNWRVTRIWAWFRVKSWLKIHEELGFVFKNISYTLQWKNYHFGFLNSHIILPRGPPHITGYISSYGEQIPGLTLKTWASTCLYWSGNKDRVVQNIVGIVLVAFTQVWQSSESFDDKASFPEHRRQTLLLLFPILSLGFQGFSWFLLLATVFHIGVKAARSSHSSLTCFSPLRGHLIPLNLSFTPLFIHA